MGGYCIVIGLPRCLHFLNLANDILISVCYDIYVIREIREDNGCFESLGKLMGFTCTVDHIGKSFQRFSLAVIVGGGHLLGA